MFAGHTRPRHAQVLAKEDYGVAMQLARENEEQLPSAPLAPQGRSGAPAPGGEWLADAQRLAQHGRLLTITCVANSRLLSLDAATGWAECAVGAARGEATLAGRLVRQAGPAQLELGILEPRAGGGGVRVHDGDRRCGRAGHEIELEPPAAAGPPKRALRDLGAAAGRQLRRVHLDWG